MIKNSQKWPQNSVFGLFKKITSFAWGKFGSQVSQRWFLVIEIPVCFNCQYFTNRLISNFDFWHVDKHE